MGWASEAFWRDLAKAYVYSNIPSGELTQRTGAGPQKGVLYMSNEVKTEVKEEKKEIKIDLAYQGYVFLGWASGIFEPKPGEKRPYYNMYVFSPVSSYVSNEYEASGFKAEKKKCVSPNVWVGMNPGDKVRLFFDDKGRVIESALEG